MKQYITVKEVAQRYSIGVSTVWQWVKTGFLPNPIRFNARSTRWDCAELDKLDQKVRAETYKTIAVGQKKP